MEDKKQTVENGSADIASLRLKIDELDRDLIRLFNERMAVAGQVAAAKAKSGAPVFVPEREEDNIRRALQQVEPRHARRASGFHRTLMRLSRNVQYEALCTAGADFPQGRLLRSTSPSWPVAHRVVIQGAAGSWSEQAARVLCSDSQIEQTVTFREACERVRSGQADAAVLPLENSTAGTVDDVYSLLQKDSLYIWRSLALPIQHQLLTRPEATPEKIHTVVSHPQALAQCSDYIAAQGWSVRETLNTAFAAKQVAGQQDPGLAAIASVQAAEACSLVVQPVDINNTRRNQTRFILVGKTFRVTPDASRISLIIKLPHTIGALAATLAVFSDNGLNLSKIQSRPDLENPWTYLFYLDFECERQALLQAVTALYQLACEMPYLRLLGWYGEISPSVACEGEKQP